MRAVAVSFYSIFENAASNVVSHPLRTISLGRQFSRYSFNNSSLFGDFLSRHFASSSRCHPHHGKSARLAGNNSSGQETNPTKTTWRSHDSLAQEKSSVAVAATGGFSPETFSVPTPKTPNQLLHTMRQLVFKRVNNFPLPRLLDFHDQFPELHSTDSYLLLLSISSRWRQGGITKRLLLGMESNSIPNDQWAFVFKLRMHMQWQRWKDAKSELQRLLPLLPSNAAVYLALLSEFDRSYAKSARNSSLKEHNLEALRECEQMLIAATIKLSTSFSIGDKTEQPGIMDIHLIAKVLLRFGRQDLAIQLILGHLQRASGKTLDPTTVARCQRAIHTVIASTNLSTPKGHRAWLSKQQLFMQLFSAHPQVIPDARAVYIFFRSLSRSIDRAEIAYDMLHQLKQLFGSQVEDTNVRRRIAVFALQQRSFSILNDMIGREEFARVTGNLWTQSASTPLSLSILGTILHRGTDFHHWGKMVSRAENKREPLPGKPLIQSQENDTRDHIEWWTEAIRRERKALTKTARRRAARNRKWEARHHERLIDNISTIDHGGMPDTVINVKVDTAVAKSGKTDC
ncbi:hypothetical protein DL96DRAFT_1702700 [Flagelloscypha sp. PMI_526]|nr:hypothetical protein DL96DRAFT_1702700 [Flagelloscypha sp. PMI_526]